MCLAIENLPFCLFIKSFISFEQHIRRTNFIRNHINEFAMRRNANSIILYCEFILPFRILCVQAYLFFACLLIRRLLFKTRFHIIGGGRLILTTTYHITHTYTATTPCHMRQIINRTKSNVLKWCNDDDHHHRCKYWHNIHGDQIKNTYNEL